MIDITKILLAIMEVIAAIITYRLVPYLKAHTTAKQQANIEAFIDVAIFAAEQIYGANAGADKFKYAEDWLLARGISVDRAQIEARVHKYFSHDEEETQDKTAEV